MCRSAIFQQAWYTIYITQLYLYTKVEPKNIISHGRQEGQE